jgi:RNA polymerase sigma-70 factor (ECF subfamily)
MRTKYKDNNMTQIIERAQNGDWGALEEIIRREQKNIYSTLYSLHADVNEVSDMTQEILLKVVRNISKLKNPQTFKTWLNQIIVRQFYDSLRKKRRGAKNVSLFEAEDGEQKELEIADDTHSPTNQVLEGELSDVIQQSIHKLPDPFRIAIVMRELQGLSYDEIAEATHTNIGTVKSRIARAREKLQGYIKPYVNQE